MKKSLFALTIAAAFALFLGSSGSAQAAPSQKDYADTIELFKNAGQSAYFLKNAYAYAVFPTVGEGAFIVGGGGGQGGVFVGGRQVGTSVMAYATLGFQMGGKAFSEIVFFKDKGAFDNFTSGDFEFGADASVTAITANASASAATNGVGAGASGGKKDAATAGGYYKGMVVFTIAKGGLMYKAAVAGQKFSYKPLGK